MTHPAPKPLQIIVCGAAGRMGARVASLAAADARFVLSACVFDKTLGDPHGALSIRPADFSRHVQEIDVVVDFSTPSSCLHFAAEAAAAKKPLVTGTTGFSSLQLAQLKSYSQKIPVFISPNFSPGVNLMFRLASEAARLLKNHQISILETHHQGKRDAPSGTALKLAETVLGARQSREPVPTLSQRVGDVVGEHTLTLAGPFERLEITHRAHSRNLFASGALEAALWIRRKKPGVYDMADLMEFA